MKSKKKGFTLIELLAVIVILAVIALIAVPTVLNIIEKARKGAFTRSAENVIKAGNLYYASSIINLEGASEITFDCDGKKCIFIKQNGEEINLGVDGNMGIGYVTVTAFGEIEILLTNGRYCASKTKIGELIINEGICSDIDLTNDTTPPEITSINTVTSTNSIIITVVAQDKESGLLGYQYSLDGTNWYPNEPQKENTYTFEGLLKENEPYTVYVKAYNGTYGKDTYTEEKGMSSLTKDNIELEAFDAPEIKVDPEGEIWASSKTVEIVFPEGDYTKEYSIDGGDTWTLTDKIIFTIIVEKETNIVARVTDGTNVKTNSKLINKIDVGESIPNVEYKTSDGNTYENNMWTNQDVTITITPSEEGVEIDKYQITYDEGKTFEDIVGNKLTIDKEGTTKVQIKAIDTVTHESELSTLYTINIDKTKPMVSYSYSVQSIVNWYGGEYYMGCFNGEITPILTISDTGGSGVSASDIRVWKDGTWINNAISIGNNEWNIPMTTEGRYIPHAYDVYDKAGNKSDYTRESDLGHLTVWDIDTSAPTMSVNFNGYTPGSWTTGNIAISLNGSNTGCETTKKYYYSINDGDWVHFGTGDTATYNIVADANYKIKFLITDGWERWGTQTENYQILRDATKPTVTITEESITLTDNAITIPFTATDNRTISSTTCEYGTSTDYGSTGVISENTCTISGLESGTEYFYKITASDGLNSEYDMGSSKTSTLYTKTTGTRTEIKLYSHNVSMIGTVMGSSQEQCCSNVAIALCKYVNSGSDTSNCNTSDSEVISNQESCLSSGGCKTIVTQYSPWVTNSTTTSTCEEVDSPDCSTCTYYVVCESD